MRKFFKKIGILESEQRSYIFFLIFGKVEKIRLDSQAYLVGTSWRILKSRMTIDICETYGIFKDDTLFVYMINPWSKLIMPDSFNLKLPIAKSFTRGELCPTAKFFNSVV